MQTDESFEQFPADAGPLALKASAKSIDCIRYRDAQGIVQFVSAAKLSEDGRQVLPNDKWPTEVHAKPAVRVFYTTG